jgi:hypothetical protein
LQKWQVRYTTSHFHVKVGANVDSLILESMSTQWWRSDSREVSG